MPHPKNQLRVLVYDDWQYTVHHDSAPSWDGVSCYQLDGAEWSMSDDDLIEFLILEGVILHNQGNVHTEGELYDVEVHNKGNVTLACAYCEGGEWFQQGTNKQLRGRVVVQESNDKKHLYGRAEFMAYFRGRDIHDELTVDDCIEIFSGILKDASDITYALLESVCSDYDVSIIDLVHNGAAD